MPAIIRVVDGRTIIKVGENTAMAAAAASLAEQFANDAILSADAAALAAAAVGVYTTVAAGEAATTNGQSFYVASGGDVTLYINNAGTGDAVASLATASDLAARPTFTELASTTPGEGAALVGVQRPEVGTVPQSAFEIMTRVVTPSPLSFGGKGDGTTDDTAAILETIKRTGRTFLPHGTWLCDAEALVSPTLNPGLNGLNISGEGRESVLQFDDGGLRLSGNISRNSQLRDFRIHLTGSGATALSYEDITVNSAPTRISLDNVELSSVLALGNTGLMLRGGWIGTYNNPVIRGFGGAGVLMERSADGPQVSWNGFNFVGGEIQGNGTGVDIEGALNVNFFGTAIEGNRGSGAFLRDSTRAVSFYGVYFEANGIDDPTGTNDIRIEASNALSTIYSVLVDSGCTFLRGGVGSETAIWANRCQALLVEEGAAFNGYVNRLNVQQMAPNTITGALRSISIGRTIPIINNSNSFGDPKSLVSAMGALPLPDSTTTVSPDISLNLPSGAATSGEITINYIADNAGDVFFQVQPFDVTTGTARGVVNVIPTAVVGRNIATATINFDSRSMRGQPSVICIARLGNSPSDTNTGSVSLQSVEVRWLE